MDEHTVNLVMNFVVSFGLGAFSFWMGKRHANDQWRHRMEITMEAVSRLCHSKGFDLEGEMRKETLRLAELAQRQIEKELNNGNNQ